MSNHQQLLILQWKLKPQMVTLKILTYINSLLLVSSEHAQNAQAENDDAENELFEVAFVDNDRANDFPTLESLDDDKDVEQSIDEVKYGIVSVFSLLQLFVFCFKCGTKITANKHVTQRAGVIKIKYYCKTCNGYVKWCSDQEARNGYFTGILKMITAAVTSPIPFTVNSKMFTNNWPSIL